MRIRPGQREATARVLASLAAGERVAARCASAQRELAGERALSRFLGAQARQERQHALVLEAGVRWLAPKGVPAVPAEALLGRYEALLGDALSRGDLAESLLGQQVVMEGLGEIVLERLDEGIDRRGGGLRRVRRTILRQERAHHDVGLRRLGQLVAARPEAARPLRDALPDYLALVDAMAADIAGLLVAFDESPADYAAALRDSLPGWLAPGRASS